MKTSIQRAPRRAPHALAAALALALSGVAEPGSAATQSMNPGRPGAAPHSDATLAQRSGDFSHLRAAFAHAAAAKAAVKMPSRAPLTRHVQSLSDSGPGSLRETLASAVDGDVVDLGDLRGRITLASSLVTSADVTIKGPGRDLLTIDGAQRGRVITSNGSLALSGVSITGGAVVDGGSTYVVGGCLFVQGDLHMTNATISGCSIGDATMRNAYGGAIGVGGTAYVKYSTISDSTVTANQFTVGGGIVSIGQTAFLSSTISGNHVNQVAAPEGSTPGTSSVFFAGGGGAAVPGMNSNPNMYTAVVMSNVTNNSVAAAGGVYSNGTDVLPVDGHGIGGGMLVAAPTVIASTISGNATQSNGNAYGGGVYATAYLPPPPTLAAPGKPLLTLGGAIPSGTAPSFKYADISGNSVTSSNGDAHGGGLASVMPLTIVASAFTHNTAHTTGPHWAGGGAAVSMHGGLSILASTISGNQATSDDAGGLSWGGGVAMWWNEPLQMTESTVSGNQSAAPAGGYSGGIGASIVQIANSTIAFNTAQYNGGLTLYGNAPSSQSIISTIIANNTATDNPGGADLYATDNPAIDGDHNLVISGSGLTWSTSTPLTTDPHLLPLAFNGGPTQTHALPVGSAAVDAGSNPQSLTYDQRNYARVVGASADIGAYELDTDRIFTNGFDAQLGGP